MNVEKYFGPVLTLKAFFGDFLGLVKSIFLIIKEKSLD